MTRRKKQPKPHDPEQSARFIETAGRIELVENPEEAFKEAFGKIIKAESENKKEQR